MHTAATRSCSCLEARRPSCTQGSNLFYFRDELLGVCKGVVPLEGARVRKHHPVQRAVGSAELRYCLVLDLPTSRAGACKRLEYELSWETAEEQVGLLTG